MPMKLETGDCLSLLVKAKPRLEKVSTALTLASPAITVSKFYADLSVDLIEISTSYESGDRLEELLAHLEELCIVHLADRLSYCYSFYETMVALTLTRRQQ
jgi:hypothetical protein